MTEIQKYIENFEISVKYPLRYSLKKMARIFS